MNLDEIKELTYDYKNQIMTIHLKQKKYGTQFMQI